MGVIARCEECKQSVGGIITSEHSCCIPEFTCENCMKKDDFDNREDPIMDLTHCNDCYKISKYDKETGRWECGHKANWVNWCEKCHEKRGDYFRKGTGSNLCLCDDCYTIWVNEQQNLRNDKQ